MRACITRLVIVGALSAAGSASAQDSLTAVKDLYESAAYEEALSELDRISTAAAPSVDQRTTEVRQYRALCLIALERTADAEGVIEELIVDNPRYRPDLQASPRWVGAVRRVHSRVMTSLVRSRFAEGKRHFDAKEFLLAEAEFEMTLSLLDNPALERSVVESLTDVLALSRGFLRLSRAATAVPPKPAPQRTGVGVYGYFLDLSAAMTAPPRTGPVRPAIYSSVTEGVAPPVAIRHDLPPWNTEIYGHSDGELDMVISETGAVEWAQLPRPVHPLYDAALLDAAKNWKYEPAMKDGIPVRFRQTVRVSLGSNQIGLSFTSR